MTTNSSLFPSDLLASGQECQQEYRCAFLARDVRFFSLVLCLSLALILLLVRLDVHFLAGQPLLPWMLGFRLLFFGFSSYTLIRIQRLHDPARLDRWILAWATFCVMFVLVANLPRPTVYTGYLSLNICLVSILYVIQPGPVLWRVLPPVVFSLSHLLLLPTVPSPHGSIFFVTALSAHLVINVVGWLVSSNWYHYRQSSFAAQKALELLYQESEQRRLAAETSEEIWERIVDTSTNMLMVVDKQQRIIRVNRAFANRFNISKEAALGRRCCKLLCGLETPPTHCHLQDTCKANAPQSMETFMPGPGLYVRLLSSPLVDRPEHNPATVVLIQDISDWKRAQLALENAREQYRSLVENCHGIIFTITPEGFVTYASPSFSKLLGFGEEYIVGKHFREVVHPGDVGKCEAFRQELLQSEEGRQGLEYRIFHQDGSIRWHLANFIPRLNDRGEVDSFVGNAMDITGQKQHQAQLKAAHEKAEEASRVKSDFLALISHEIRTPLNAVVGFSGLARRATDPVQLRQYTDVLDQSAHLLMDLVNDILDMSKVEAGQLTIDTIPFNLPETLEMLRWQFTPVVEKKPGVELSLQLGSNLPTWVMGDPLRLRQVLSNLLGNALKFTESGSVRLEVRGEGGTKEGGNCWLSFAVKDTGIGIDLSKEDLLFQPFQQVEPGVTRKYGGTGLGLAIVRRLVELMEGRIEVQSRLGRGSCFTVHLALCPCSPMQYAQVASTSPSPLSILVVEDNDYNRLLLQETLSQWGHRVTSAEHGNDALILVGKQHFDCIILDLWMPDLDGFELCARLRSRESVGHLQPTPIIAYTADTDDCTRKKVLEAGGQGVLGKPLDLQQLRLTLNKCCKKSKVQPNPERKAERDEGIGAQMEEYGLNARVISDMGYDQKRLAAYADLLWGDIEIELHRIEQALLVEDRQEVLQAAHSLKGLCGYLRNTRAGELALRIHKDSMDLSFLRLNDLVQQLHRVATRPPATQSSRS